MKPAYKRILLKLSGEALMGDDSYGINRAVIERIVAEIAEIVRLGVEMAIPVRARPPGGRGSQAGEDIAAADHDRHFHAQPDYFRDLGDDALDHFAIDAVAVVAHQGFAAELEQDALVGGCAH